ncbi:TPA: molecular chaperone, partial [Klebsiella pneumoniae]|nr:molecular chaperone [Klebsiella pneumoniae]
SEKKNVMQVAIQSRIKLFYRPQSIQRSSHVNPEQKITLQTVGNQLTITNPTPYYFTALAVKDSQGNKIKEVDGEMVAPHSDRNISVAGLRLGQRISISYINDFGGVISMLYRCENNICKFEKSNEG